MPHDELLKPLVEYLHKVPAITGSIGSGLSDEGFWWVKFAINISHPLAWRVVQELGHVLNYVSLDERLPTVFMPVSPPPYMNGGPEQFLSWVIECRDEEFLPEQCAEWLQGRLPSPLTTKSSGNLRTKHSFGASSAVACREIPSSQVTAHFGITVIRLSRQLRYVQ
jgi:hypothetical protein